MYIFQTYLPLLFVLLFLVCLLFCKSKDSYLAPRLEFFGNITKFSSFKTILQFLIVLSLSLAIASLVKIDKKNQYNKIGYDFVLAVDVSGSMIQSGFDEEDRMKSKFDVVRENMNSFISSRINDNIGVVLFGDYGIIFSPITHDKDMLLQFTNMIELGIVGQSTAIGEGLAQSVRSFENSKSETKVVVLLTDGEHNSGSISPKESVAYAKENNVKVYTIGIGSDYNKPMLEHISNETNGKFFAANNKESLDEVYKTIDKLEKSNIDSGKKVIESYYFIYFALFSLALLAIYIYLFVSNKIGFIVVALLVIIAIFRPYIKDSSEVLKFRGSSVVLAMDFSKSMQVDDIEPSRLAVVKTKAIEVVNDSLEHDFAPMIFTSNSVVISPFSNDKELISNAISNLSSKNIVTKSTDILQLIQYVSKLSDNYKIELVIMSDGGDSKEFDEAIKIAKDNGITIHTILVASEYGSMILDENQKALKDQSGNIIISYPNRSFKALSANTNGIHIDIKSGNDSLDDLVSYIDSNAKKEFDKVNEDRRVELFQYFLVLALLLFIFLLYSKSIKEILLKSSLVALIFGSNANANDLLNKHYFVYKDYNKAIALYNEKNYKESAKLLSSLKTDDAVLKSNIYSILGNCAVKLKKYDIAKSNYKKSLILSYDNDTFYNYNLIKELSSKNSKKDSSSAGKKVMMKDSKKDDKANRGVKIQLVKSLNDSQSRKELSYKQYSLINKGYISEKAPY